MSVSIGSIQLSQDLILPKNKNEGLVRVSVGWTLGGLPIVRTSQMAGGEALVLTDISQLGAYTGSQIDAIKSNYYTPCIETIFTHHLGSWNVYITGMDFTDYFQYANPGDEETYSGTITMIGNRIGQ